MVSRILVFVSVLALSAFAHAAGRCLALNPSDQTQVDYCAHMNGMEYVCKSHHHWCYWEDDRQRNVNDQTAIQTPATEATDLSVGY